MCSLFFNFLICYTNFIRRNAVANCLDENKFELLIFKWMSFFLWLNKVYAIFLKSETISESGIWKVQMYSDLYE